MSTRKRPKNPIKPVRRMASDLYHALHFSSLAYGGIGGGVFSDMKGNPVCVVGHWGRLFGPGPLIHTRKTVLLPSGTGISANDIAVRAVNERKGNKNRDARITFEEWCAELNVVPAK